MSENGGTCRRRNADAYIRGFGGPYVLGQDEEKLRLIRGAPHTHLTSTIERGHSLIYTAIHLAHPPPPGARWSRPLTCHPPRAPQTNTIMLSIASIQTTAFAGSAVGASKVSPQMQFGGFGKKAATPAKPPNCICGDLSLIHI